MKRKSTFVATISVLLVVLPACSPIVKNPDSTVVDVVVPTPMWEGKLRELPTLVSDPNGNTFVERERRLPLVLDFKRSRVHSARPPRSNAPSYTSFGIHDLLERDFHDSERQFFCRKCGARGRLLPIRCQALQKPLSQCNHWQVNFSPPSMKTKSCKSKLQF